MAVADVQPDIEPANEKIYQVSQSDDVLSQSIESPSQPINPSTVSLSLSSQSQPTEYDLVGVGPSVSGNWSGGTDVYPLGSVILRSIFGKADPNNWRPLRLSTFFSEGWREPWVPEPVGPGGVTRQGWIDAADGAMYPGLWFFTFAQGFNEQPKSNAYLGSYTLFTPFNRRMLLITNIPFVLTNNAADGLPTISPGGTPVATSRSHTTFGDVSFTPRFLLHETRDFSVTADLTVVTPTGNMPLAGSTSLAPTIAFWNNIGDGWVVRGGLGVSVPLNGRGSDTLISQFAIGRMLTGHDVPWFGDFTCYLSTIVETPVSNGGATSVRLTPGIRTHLGNEWYFLAGLPTPGTPARIANLGMIFWFMKVW